MRMRKIRNKIHFLFSDPFMLFSTIFPLIYLAIFLLIPLALPLSELLKSNPMRIAELVFQNPRYVSTKPIGNVISIRNVVFGGSNITLILLSGVSYGSIINSFIVATITMVVSTAVGTLIAIVLTLYDFPGRRFLQVLAMLPLFAAPFASGYVVRKFFDWRYGLLSYMIDNVLGIPVRIGLEGLAGVVIAQILGLYVIVYLNVSAAIANIDYTLIEQAQNLGSSTFRVLKDVVLPLALPGIATGASLTFILSLEDIANPIVFGEDRLISYEIFRSFQDPTTGARSPAALLMTVIVVLVSAIIFILIRGYVSLKSYASIGRGAKPLKPFKLSRIGTAIVYLFLLPFLLFSSIPQIGVFVLAFSSRWYSALPEGFTSDNFVSMLTDPIVSTAIRNSLLYSITALGIILVISILIAYSSTRARGAISYILDTLATIPVAIPGIAIASGFFLLFTTPPFKNSVFDPVVYSPGIAITIAYTIRRMPFMVRAIYAGLQQIPTSLEEAAINLGASRFLAIATVILPAIAINIFGGAITTFVYCISETSVGVMLGGLKGVSIGHAAPITFVMQNYLETPQGTQIVGALGAVLIVLQLIAVTISTFLLKGYSVFGVR
ncbi:MAG: iron ABC transporter permease [Ignisphaera sp.]